MEKFKENQRLAVEARIKGKEEKKLQKAKDREDSKAFGVPDFYSVLRMSLKKFDELHKDADAPKKDDVKKIRNVMIELIITNGLSCLEIDRAKLERLAQKYVKSASIRTAREQLSKG